MLDTLLVVEIFKYQSKRRKKSITMVMDFKDVSSATGLKTLNEYLACRSYISGPEPSQNDLILFRVISLDLCKDKELVNVKRWYMHIKSFSGDEMKSFPHAKEHIKITYPEGSEVNQGCFFFFSFAFCSLF